MTEVETWGDSPEHVDAVLDTSAASAWAGNACATAYRRNGEAVEVRHVAPEMMAVIEETGIISVMAELRVARGLIEKFAELADERPEWQKSLDVASPESVLKGITLTADEVAMMKGTYPR